MNMNHHNYYMELVNDRDYGKKYDIIMCTWPPKGTGSLAFYTHQFSSAPLVNNASHRISLKFSADE